MFTPNRSSFPKVFPNTPFLFNPAESMSENKRDTLAMLHPIPTGSVIIGSTSSIPGWRTVGHTEMVSFVRYLLPFGFIRAHSEMQGSPEDVHILGGIVYDFTSITLRGNTTGCSSYLEIKRQNGHVCKDALWTFTRALPNSYLLLFKNE